MSLSVAIVAKDEADRLPRCLSSVSFADEVLLVVDIDSKDGSVELAREFGCQVLQESWMGYAWQKQFAVDKCSNDWVLILDADEVVPQKTAEKIIEITGSQAQEFAAYSFLRKNFFHGRWIRHCGWWPERVVRLVDRRQGRFSDHFVHERWISNGPVKELDLSLEHYSFRNYSGLINKMEEYSTLAAQEMAKKGEGAGWWTPISHGVWMFVRTYFFEMGFIEGFDGFFISLLNAEGSFMKYAKLREIIKYGKA
ncbi:MAG TPA: glycosyltransferase family 2 protein [Desulfatiglandales bacterium]|nr:glycosyltransferase family 2 protein [Desulfatiglandales bacterium]